MEDNIKIYFKKIRQEGVNWIYLAQNRYDWRSIVNSVINFVLHKLGEPSSLELVG
jgi:hypothetical protein